MKERFGNSKKWTRIILVSVFFLILGCSLAGEKVAKNNGIGWDGENYLNTIQHFTELITTHGYDQYAIQRIMPWGLVNVVFQICHIEATPHNALIAGGVLIIIALSLAIFFFFRISTLKEWKLSTEVIAFSALFYSYAMLKVRGYVILSSDVFAFLWGIMYVYYFSTNRRIILLLLAILGAVNWPGVALLSGLALVFFPHEKLTIQKTLNKGDAFVYYTMLWGISLIPLLYQIASLIVPPNHNVHMFNLDGRPETNILYFFLSVFCVCMYWYFLIRPYRISFSQIWKSINKRNTWIGLVAMLAIYIASKSVLKLLAGPADGTLNTKGLIQNILLSGTVDPFAFVESFFAYYGPVVLVVLLLWQQSAKYIVKEGLGYFFVIALSIFFAVRPEARVSIMFVPFVVIPVMEYIDTLDLQKWVAPVYMVASIILSHVWFPINVEGIEAAFEEETYANLSTFPAQRFFMCSGHWQSHEMYAIFMFITIIVGAILYIGIRYKWFIKNRV